MIKAIFLFFKSKIHFDLEYCYWTGFPDLGSILDIFPSFLSFANLFLGAAEISKLDHPSFSSCGNHTLIIIIKLSSSRLSYKSNV